jgi:PAS domain S-box-containing protein
VSSEGSEPSGLSTVVEDEEAARREARERRLAAQYLVTKVLAESPSFREAAPAILRAVCRGLGWLVGVMWEVDPHDDVLRFVDAWHEPSERAAEFVTASIELAFPPGVGLPGRVWRSGEPLWVRDLSADETFPRASDAAHAGLRAAFAAPIMLGGETLGVMEFFGPEIAEPDEDLLRMTSSVGSQVGQYINRKRAERNVRDSRDQLDTILASVSEGIVVERGGGRFVFANKAAAQLLGYPSVEALLEASVAEAFGRFEIEDEEGRPLPRHKLPGRRALRGRATSERLLKLRERDTGDERWLLVEATAIGERERPELAVTVLRDVTERRRAEETQRFLAEASEILGSSLNYGRTLQQIADLAVPRLADWCVVETTQPDRTLLQVAVAASDPAKLALLRELRERFPPGPHQSFGAPEVARTGRSEIYPETTDELVAGWAREPEELEMLRRLGHRSAIAVPMVARGRVNGVMTLVAAESGRRYGSGDLELVEELAGRAAVAVDNAMLYQARSAIARSLQRSLLPPALPMIPFAELAARYHAGGDGIEVGGDVYDVFEVDGGAWGVVVGDVCGKGPEAAALTALARHSLRTAALRERDPALAIQLLNQAILAQLEEEASFFTAVYALLEPAGPNVELTLARAGHPPPLVVRGSGRVERLAPSGGVLGVFEELEIAEVGATLAPGDALVLYTDGLLAALGTPLQEDTLVSLLSSCAGIGADEIAARIEAAATEPGADAQRDDIALLVLRVAL